MALTYTTWKSQTQPVREKAQRVQEHLLRQAAVEAKLLTGHAAWDTYLSRLQVLLHDAQDEVKRVQDLLAGPLTEEQVRLNYLTLNVMSERVRVLQQCMNLPRELVTHGDELGSLPHAD